MTINWKHWNRQIIESVHGKVYYYRKLYEGKHSEIFPRAERLIQNGEIVDNIYEGRSFTQNVQTPYIIANVSKLIPEIPAILVSRSLGAVQSSIHSTDEQNAAANSESKDRIDGPTGDAANNTVTDLQQETIDQIADNTKLQFEHWSNIVQQQVDGGLVGVPWEDDRGLRIEFKQRDVYFPHGDGLGADLVYERIFDDDYILSESLGDINNGFIFDGDTTREIDKYLHVYRERVEPDGLRATNILYLIDKSDQLTLVDDAEACELLGLDELETFYAGRTRPFIVYWPNEKTFINPLGVSCLKGQEGKQDEINWTLTRNAITFERNGKPRIAVTKEVMRALKNAAFERYGDDSKIDHRDLEITTLDDNGNALEVIQIDITKIGDISWVKDLMKMMLMETKTSERAIDFYFDDQTAPAVSGIAKFYDLFVSIIKSEQLQQEYIYFLKQLFENCLWLANQKDPAVIIEEPEIQTKDMIPVSRQEATAENVQAYAGGVQSLETTVRQNNPDASEEWIQAEIERIESEKQSDDTTSLMMGRSTLSNFMDNRDENGNPIQKEDQNKGDNTNE